MDWMSGRTDAMDGVTMTTNPNDLDQTVTLFATAQIADDAHEPENGSHLREATRQVLSNGLDMTNFAADLYGGHCCIVVSAPHAVGAGRFHAILKAVVALIRQRMTSGAYWQIEVRRAQQADGLRAWLVFQGTGSSPFDPDALVDFLGDLGVWPED